MKNITPILTLTIIGCGAPIIDESLTAGSDANSDQDLNETENSESTENSDIDNDESNDDSLDGSTDFTIESGTWRVASAYLTEDTCDWDTQLKQIFGMGSDALLPNDFDVVGYDGYFTIEANSYGAEGPIDCIQNDEIFSCDTQSVTPIDFDLGSFGWTYAIVFNGTVNDERSIEGTTFVSFPTVSDFLVPIFESAGIDISQCTQTYELSIVNDL